MGEALFDYRVRVSPKARHIRLRVTVQGGLEVVLPGGYDQGKIPALLERKKHWIREALDRAEQSRKFFEPEPTWRVPLQIKLPAVGAVWHVEKREVEGERVTIREAGEGRLLVAGRIEDQATCCEALGRWLLRQTREHLIPRLQTVSLRTGLKYNRAFVKRQRTRWASCSSQKSISLNVKLLFLPPQLVDYALVHELCHTKEMNHSEAFWAVVERHCPNYRELDERLRGMWKLVPRWAA